MAAGSLRRRVTAEAVGTGFLVAAVIGSGIAAHRLSPNDVGLQLLENAIATGATLTVLILALQPVSAAFNPIVTAIERLTGAINTKEAAATVMAQVVGGTAGAVLANLMFSEPAVSISGTGRAGSGQLLGEVIATAGLIMIITALSRARRAELVAFAVGGYITAAYWFTSSTSFANPAVTIARMFSDTFAGIHPISVPPFLLAEAVGGATGYVLARTIYPRSAPLPLAEDRLDHESDASSFDRE
jgi:glycerol uptake facilitator-like aquaporin